MVQEQEYRVDRSLTTPCTALKPHDSLQICPYLVVKKRPEAGHRIGQSAMKPPEATRFGGKFRYREAEMRVFFVNGLRA